MNVAFASPFAVIMCSHIGCESNSGWPGSEPIAVVAGERGDVELAGAGEQLSVRRDADRSVEPDPGVRALVQGHVDRGPGLGREPPRELRRRAVGDRLAVGPGGRRESLVDGEVGAEGELLETDELSAVLAPVMSSKLMGRSSAG
jgi:hypothetical protein